MYTVGRYISQGVYTVAGPFHPFGGAVDIIVVQQEDGSFKSSPWYVKFGKFQGVLKQKENVVDVAVNGNDVDFHMFLDATGEAYFLKDADLDSEGSILSPRSTNTENGESEDEKKEEDKKEEENRDGLAIEVVSSIAIQNSPGKEAENLGRRSLVGIMFQGHGGEQLLAESAKSSLERAETISDLLENSWECGSGLKNGQSQPTIESQTPIASSLLYSQHEAAVQDSYSRSSHSQRSEKVETMRREEELAVNEGNVMPANKDSTLSSSLCLQGGETSIQSNVLVKGSLPAGVEVSLCRHLLKEHMGSEEAAEAFASVKVSLHEFKSNAASIIANDKLVVRVGGQYYPWSVAAPVVLGILTFGQVIMPATDGAIPIECPEPVPKTQAAVGTIVPAARGGWNLWPFPLRRPKTPEQSIVPNPLVSRDTLLLASGTAVQSPFVNDLMLQNAYYERPRRSKVRTIIPTSQMLAQMNLKEGNNRITFTFFTRMLGNQQVDARVYLWKWNTRIVISDVDGTITKSDVLGQVMPLVGKDWTQSGVARLFSAIKENGYELLFLSARAISQADLTRQFLFNVKQDGETLPDGPVVISPDGLFPSLYREVIRRTPHEFKIGCLQDIRSLFPEGCNPFYAGFGNRDTDEISYLKVGIPKGKIFIINPKGEVAVNNRVHVKTYTSLHKLVNDMFPAQTYMEQEDYNSWNFWKLPLPDIEDDLKSVSASSSKRS
ncbi:unnamed protein product [Sphagnum tenellum]